MRLRLGSDPRPGVGVAGSIEKGAEEAPAESSSSSVRISLAAHRPRNPLGFGHRAPNLLGKAKENQEVMDKNPRGSKTLQTSEKDQRGKWKLQRGQSSRSSLPEAQTSSPIIRNEDVPPHREMDPDRIDFTIGTREQYTTFIMDLRTKLHEANHGDIFNENPRAYPVLPKQKARPDRWLRIRLNVEEGGQRISTSLAVRDDNLYVKGFQNQSGVWYELCGPSERSARMLPYISEKLEAWDVSYRSILGIKKGKQAQDQVKNMLRHLKLGKSFAKRAVRRLSRYPDLENNDDYPVRLGLAGLIVMVCEAARMSLLHDTFVGGWDHGTGLPLRVVDFIWEWRYMSQNLRSWKKTGYRKWSRDINRPGLESAGHALACIHLVLNGTIWTCVARGSGQSGDDGNARGPGHHQSGKDGNDEGPGQPGSKIQGPGQSGEYGRKTQAPSQSRKDGNARRSPGQSKQDDDEDQPSEDDDEDQPSEHDNYTQFCIRPRVEIFSVHADFPIAKISVFDGIRGQIIYRQEQKPEAFEETNKLLLTGPYRGISGYGCFSIQADMPGSTGGDGEPSSTSGDPGGQITWEWDCYKQEYADQVDAPRPVTRTITLDPSRNIHVTYLVMSNAQEATVQVNLTYKNVYGKITAHIGEFEEGITLFSCSESRCLYYFSLTRSVVAVPWGCPLQIKGDLHVETDRTNGPLMFDFKFWADGRTSDSHTTNSGYKVEVNISWRQQEKIEMDREPDLVYTIGDGESFHKFINELRSLLADHPDRSDVLEGHPDQKLSSTRNHPVLVVHPILDLVTDETQHQGRLLHIKLQLVGEEAQSTTLVIRVDNLLVKGFKNKSGVWFELRSEDRPKLPPEYNSLTLGWDPIYKNDEMNEEILDTLASSNFGQTLVTAAVGVLSRYPDVEYGEKPNPRLALAGLSFIVSEPAKINPLLDTFVRCWNDGTVFTRKLMAYITCWKLISSELLEWQRMGYDKWYQFDWRLKSIGIKSPEDALEVIHLVYNGRLIPI